MSENRRRRNNGAQNRQVKKARTNNARRILLLVGLMSLVAVISIGGTIAWLTDKTDPVTNTFTTANIDIELTETWNTDTDNDKENDTWKAKLIPGTTYAKDPKVTVKAGSEPCWLFIKVTDTNNKVTGLEGNVLSYSVNTKVWKPLTGHDGFYYTKTTTMPEGDTHYYVLAGKETEPYNNGYVTVNEDLTKAMEESMRVNKKTPTITVMAAAVQSDNVASVDKAWAKLPTEFTDTTTTTTP